MSEYISIKSLASFHNLDENLLLEIVEYEIVPIKRTRSEVMISSEYLDEFERALRLHLDLGVNLQGVDIICHMRNQIREMQDEIARLNRLLEFK